MIFGMRRGAFTSTSQIQCRRRVFHILFTIISNPLRGGESYFDGRVGPASGQREYGEKFDIDAPMPIDPNTND